MRLRDGPVLLPTTSLPTCPQPPFATVSAAPQRPSLSLNPATSSTRLCARPWTSSWKGQWSSWTRWGPSSIPPARRKAPDSRLLSGHCRRTMSRTWRGFPTPPTCLPNAICLPGAGQESAWQCHSSAWAELPLRRCRQPLPVHGTPFRGTSSGSDLSGPRLSCRPPIAFAGRCLRFLARPLPPAPPCKRRPQHPNAARPTAASLCLPSCVCAAVHASVLLQGCRQLRCSAGRPPSGPRLLLEGQGHSRNTS